VAADSLYEAVAQGLRAFRANDWVDDISQGHTISVVVTQPEIEHRVHLRDFERWLESQGRSPAEVSLKNRLRELLKSDVPSAGSVATGRSGGRNRDR
jgi:hypothetical protein